MRELTNLDLEKFGKYHYTYINQIFGDVTVREIISEIFPNKRYSFRVETAGEGFEQNTDHHILFDQIKNQIICSTKLKCNGHICQDIRRDINDTLCQSYSLLTFMNKKIKRGKKERQMEMIKMYREILKSPKFIEKLNEEILTNSDNKRLWINFTNEKSFDIEFVNMNHSKLINNIHKALNKWENYGYMYFIGKGEVLSKNKY